MRTQAVRWEALARVLVCGLVLWCNALPALANFAMSPSGPTTAFAIDAANQGTVLCAAASTECSAHVLINTAGAPIGVSGTPLFAQLAAGAAAIGSVTANAGTNLNTSLLALESGGNLATLAGAITAAVQQANVKQINGVVPLMGNGVTGTGSQRVTIASDNTAFAVNATLQPSSATAIGTVNPTTIGNWGLQASTQNSATPTNAHLIAGQFNTTPTTIATGNVSPLQMDNAGNLLVNIKAGAGSGGTAIADNAAFTQGTTNETPIGCFFTSGAYSAITTTHVGVAQCDATGHLMVNVSSAVGLAAGSTTSGQTGSAMMGAVTTAAPTYTAAQTNFMSLDTHGGVRIGGSGYPAGATPETISATGTTGATTATLATGASVTTYICGFSIRANATAAATANSTVTGTITGTLNYTQWTAPNASGIGLTEQIFSPCIPASAVNTGIAVVSAAPGTGGVVSVTAWGFTL